jgi:hypothetical protein
MLSNEFTYSQGSASPAASFKSIRHLFPNNVATHCKLQRRDPPCAAAGRFAFNISDDVIPAPACVSPASLFFRLPPIDGSTSLFS